MQVNGGVGQARELVRFRTRSSRRRGAAVVVALGVFWWLFGISVLQGGSHPIVLQRVFGRVTRVHMLVGFRETDRLLYPWSMPFTPGDPVSSCGAIHPQWWMDRNDDGRWDTWLVGVGPDKDGECGYEYRVDTTLSGKPDWTFTKPFLKKEEAMALIKARRGF